MKRVSFKIAKALKEAGYPQFESAYHWCANWNFVKKEYQWQLNEVPYMWTPGDGDEKKFVDAPTYIEAWIWMWREKGIRIEAKNHFDDNGECCWMNGYIDVDYADPEEAIIKAIEYLCDANLIK